MQRASPLAGPTCPKIVLGELPQHRTQGAVQVVRVDEIIWVNHHARFASVGRVDRPLLFLNLLLLLSVSTIPFPSASVGGYIGSGDASHPAAAIYGGIMVVMSVAFTTVWRHVTRDARLVAAYLDPRRARAEGRLFPVGLIAYLVGIGLAAVSARSVCCCTG